MERNIFFRPKDSYVGDVIPYYENAVYYLYFLNDRRPTSVVADRTDWSLVTTTDFVNYEYHGTALPIGTMEEPDNCCYTGSIYKNGENDYHLFYTAQNSYNDRYKVDGHPVQTIMHATSKDLIHWEKYPERFWGDGETYEILDWRDPFVFYNEKEACYNMLVTARKKSGSFRKGGCTLKCRSKNLFDWEIAEPFYDPERYYALECPDLFEMNGWWYLVFSTFTELFATHYRKARSIEGPWEEMVDDTWDARNCYAIKTAGDGTHRYAFGWIPTRHGARDAGTYHWGGNLCVHELIQKEDGTLYAVMPSSIRNAFPVQRELSEAEMIGNVEKVETTYQLKAKEKTASVMFDELPEECLIDVELEFDQSVISFGLDMNAGEDRDEGYFFRFEPFYQRLVFDWWPRATLSDDAQQQHYLGGDIPFQAALERPLRLQNKNTVKVSLLVKDGMMVCYANEETALSVRTYDLMKNRKWGIWAAGGEIKIHSITLKTAGGEDK